MIVQTFTTKLSIEEKETHFWICAEDDNLVKMETTILKDYNKAKKQGWTQTVRFEYQDGTVAGGRFEAPRRCMSVRNTKERVLTEKQLQNLDKIRKRKEELE